MTGKNRIIAIGSGGNEPPVDEAGAGQDGSAALLLTDLLADQPGGDEGEAQADEGYRRSPGLAWLPPALAGMAGASWTGFYGWARWAELRSGIAPAGWAQLIADWSVPVLLIGVAWLLFMRNSRTEARRFGDAAHLLADESSRLEASLLTVNRELSLAREFIAAQSRDLESLGRVAANRLSHNADRLQELIRDNGERVDAIGTVSEAALENMEKLRGQLPVIASAAKDVTNNIANAGRTAHVQLEEMIGGFKRLDEFGQACGREVLSLRERTGETIAEFERHCQQMDEIATTRFAALNEQQAELRTRLEMQEVEALASIRTRASALAEELDAAKRQLDSDEEARLASLKARLSTLRDEGGAVTQSLRENEEQAISDWKSGLAAFDAERSELFAAIGEAEERMALSAQTRLQEVASDAERIETQLAQGSHTFAEGLERMRREAEAGNSHWIAGLSESLDTMSREIAGRGQRLGEELGRQHELLQSRHEQALAKLSARCAALDEEISTRASALLAQLESHQDRVGTGHAGLLDDLAKRFAELEAEAAGRSQTLSGEILRQRSEFSAGQAQAIAELREMLAAMDQEIDRRLERHEQQGAGIARKAQEVTEELEASGQRLEELAAQGEEQRKRITGGLEAITSGVFHAQSLLGRAKGDVAQLTDASVRLLELIQASSKNSRSDLPEALGQSEERLAALDARITQMRETLLRASEAGEALAGRIESSDGALNALISQAEVLHRSFDDRSDVHAEALAGLLRSLEELDRRSGELAGRARAELTQAIAQLAQSAHEAVAAIGETGAANISELAARLGTESAEALDRAIRTTAAEASGKLEQAAAHASGVSREATIQLRDQLAKVNELVGNLEQRVAHARARAEDQVDNDFARRVALITESLNSNAIDIAKALSTEVSDTAWAAYLRGDRGIFTRRAVSLLDASEARSIQQIFERDHDFREHVSRYIHDFEAILRQVLSTRDGHALGVTLLSSDMGKLYVALAQAIERLRD